jgi:putative transcriptional regulator
MPIILRLDVMLAKRKVRSNVLARAIGITEANLSLLKSGKVKGMKFETLEAICAYLRCQPGDILEYAPDGTPASPRPRRHAQARRLTALQSRRHRCDCFQRPPRRSPSAACCSAERPPWPPRS